MKFLRYPGGKQKQLLFLASLMPAREQIVGKYIEPFVGGGSVYLSLQPHRAAISDLNQELVDLYNGIKLYPHKVWDIFRSIPEGKESYYAVRDGSLDHKHLSYRAARTLYLNRTCFKGMWRHGPQGKFSVGYGGEDRRWVITHDNLFNLSQVFRQAQITKADFETALNDCQDGDFVFLDPPYKPGERELFEAHYTHGRFTFEEQERLSQKIRQLCKKKRIKWLMTNSSHPDVCGLYKNFNLVKIPRGTSNIVGVYTGDPQEVVISNYRVKGVEYERIS